MKKHSANQRPNDYDSTSKRTCWKNLVDLRLLKRNFLLRALGRRWWI